METFVVLTKLTAKGKHIVKNNPEEIKISTNAVSRLGGEIITQFALLGPYDFVTILRAKDEHVVYKLTSEIGALGTVETLTMPAITIDSFINDIKGN